MQFGNHALAINLLASYLTEVADRDIERAAAIQDIGVSEPTGKHPRRVVAALERHLAHQPEVEQLRILGLFDRPVSQGEITAVLAEPAIPHLTERLAQLSSDQYAAVLQRLRSLGLIARESRHRPLVLDAHPLIREHFAAQLVEHWPEAARESSPPPV